ncbi:MAG: acetylxylan esterase [Thermoguttaceae bacterium]|jgi:cephalosporin-C deacetylase-like acetyl esterase|nr:acetylxylan esterase [Thermoguttaceae bacterium]
MADQSSSDRGTPEQFAAYQEKRRHELWGLLGDLPPRRKPEGRVLRTEQGRGYTLEHLELDLNGIEPVPAILLLPQRRRQPAPGLVYLHSHGGNYDLGKEELLTGLDVLSAYAPVCVEKGLVTLAIDSWCFSGRKHQADGQRGEHDTFKRMLWRGEVLWGMMLFDEFQAVSYLASRPEVDAARIGAMGLSMGSTKAWWLAALDPRVRLCINLCCLTDYEELIRIDNLAGHGIYYYVPGLLKHFQAHEICELIVPRPHLSLNGRRDLLTPPAGVERIRDHLLPLYRKYGREEDCRIELFDCGHEETAEMRALVLAWLDRLAE